MMLSGGRLSVMVETASRCERMMVSNMGSPIC
jgi:hypothetical protein